MTVRLGPATDEVTKAVWQPSKAVVKLVGSFTDTVLPVAPPSEVTAPLRGSTHAGPTACSPATQGGEGAAGGEGEYRGLAKPAIGTSSTAASIGNSHAGSDAAGGLTPRRSSQRY